MASEPSTRSLEPNSNGMHGRGSVAPSDLTRTQSSDVLDARGEKVSQDDPLLNQQEKITPFAVIICLIASMGGFVFGFDVRMNGVSENDS